MDKAKEWPPIKLWKDPKPGIPYGPSPMQRLAFIDTLPDEIRPHKHSLDVLLLIGGSGSGKSSVAIARLTEQIIKYPNVKAVVAGKNFPLIKRNVLDEFKRIFSTNFDWDHPIVKYAPTQNNLILRLVNNSQITFLNLDKFEINRGFDADIIMIDEINLLKSEESFYEMIRRSRGRALPTRQFLLTCNPVGREEWLYNAFALRQYDTKYTGPPINVGEECTCQFCQTCLNRDNEQIEWEGTVCPKCKTVKDNDCPGRQYFYRTVFSKSFDNPNLPSDYVQSMKSTLDAQSYKRYVEGEIIDIRKDKVYISYSRINNVIEKEDEIEIDFNKPLIWTFDFNFAPMCSVLLQEQPWGVAALEEIVLWDVTTQGVAQEFSIRYPLELFEGNPIHIYGDPAGLIGTGNTGQPTHFQLLIKTLNGLGYKTIQHTEKKRISIVDRVNCVNTVLLNANQEIKLKINQRCEYLLASLENIKWAPSGTKEDDNCDRNAKRSPNKDQIFTMVHPSAALGYYIQKAFPIIARKPPSYFAATSDGDSIILEDSKLTITETKPKQELSIPPASLKGVLTEMGYGSLFIPGSSNQEYLD